MPPIQLLIKPASGSCNLRCRYCFYHDEMQKREKQNYGFMSFETLEEIVKKTLADCEQQCDFIFQGGEPTLVGLDFYKKLLEFEQKYNIHNVNVMNSIQTNGYQLGEEWAEFFAANNFLVGVSLDGIKYTHDAYRENSVGKGSFGEIMKTLEMFDKKGVDYNILTVVNRRTAERITRIYEFYKKNNWKYQQYIACLDPLGEPKGSQEYSLTPEVYGEFLVNLFDLWYLDLCKGEQPYIRQFENYISLLMGYPPESCDMKGCCSIQHVVEADGSVYPCDFYVMDEYKIGSFLEDSIGEMGNRGLESGFVEASLNRPEECKTCKYAYLCRGGCRRNRQTDEAGHLGQNYFCSSYKYFFEKTHSRMEEIARQLMQSELKNR